MPACQIGHFFGTKRWITLEWRNISKIANKVSEKGPLREIVSKFQYKGITCSKFKKKRKLEIEQRETPNFLYNFVQKSNATKQLW